MTAAAGAEAGPSQGALPTMLVIGGMKSGTSALHAYLAAHPEIHMAAGKELNFFFGPDRPPHADESRWWREGQWHRGAEWYAAQFDAACPVRGEASPGYTDPSHPEAAARIASLLPRVRLVHLAREPFARALSQWRHHVRDGTERRPVEEALLDPGSQYLDRSRHHARLAPFLERFDREQLHVVVTERLEADPRAELAAVFAHVGVDPEHWDEAYRERVHVGADDPADRDPDVPAGLPAAFRAELADDVDRLRELLDDPLEEWG